MCATDDTRDRLERWREMLSPYDRRRLDDVGDLVETAQFDAALRFWLDSGSSRFDVPFLPLEVARLAVRRGLSWSDDIEAACRWLVFESSVFGWRVFREAFRRAEPGRIAIHLGELAREEFARRERCLEAAADLESDVGIMHYLMHRFSRHGGTINLRFDFPHSSGGCTDGQTIRLSRTRSEFEDRSHNLWAGRRTLLHELVHVDFFRDARGNTDPDGRLRRWHDRTPRVDGSERPEFAPNLETLAQNLQNADLLVFLANLVEDIGVEAVVEAEFPGLRRIRAEAVRRAYEEASSPTLARSWYWLRQAMCQEALGVGGPVTPPRYLSRIWARIRGTLHDLLSAPPQTRSRVLVVATELYDLLNPYLPPSDAHLFAQPGALFSGLFLVERGASAARADDEWGKVGAVAQLEDEEQRRAQRRIERSIADGRVPEEYTSFLQGEGRLAPDAMPEELYPEVDAWSRSRLFPGTRVRMPQPAGEPAPLRKRAQTFGMHVDTRSYVDVVTKGRAGVPHEPAFFRGAQPRSTTPRSVHLVLDGSISMLETRSRTVRPLDVATRLIGRLSHELESRQRPVSVHVGRDRGRWNVEVLPIKQPLEAFDEARLRALRPKGPHGCRSGAIVRAFGRATASSTASTEIILLTDTGNRYVARTRCRILEQLPGEGCKCAETGRCDGEPRGSSVLRYTDPLLAMYYPMEYEFLDLADALREAPHIRLTHVTIGDTLDWTAATRHLDAETLIVSTDEELLHNRIVARMEAADAHD